MRVHIPIVTQPTVRFISGDEETNMKPGECWIFDTWAWHRVLNDSVESRIHLVVDTVGGEKFWQWADRGRGVGVSTEWATKSILPFGASLNDVEFERTNCPVVMSPWELSGHVDFILSESDRDQAGFAAVERALKDFERSWRCLWSAFGADADGWPRYRQALDQLARRLNEARAETLRARGWDVRILSGDHPGAVGSAPNPTAGMKSRSPDAQPRDALHSTCRLLDAVNERAL